MHSIRPLIVLLVLGTSALGQHFHPKIDDRAYLDTLQHSLEKEVNTTREELVEQAKIAEVVAKKFVAAQIKENLFLALRVMADKELQAIKTKADESLPSKSSVNEISGRRDDDVVKDLQELQVINVIKRIYNHRMNILPRRTMKAIPALLDKPVDEQLVGLLTALTNESQTQENSTSTNNTSSSIIPDRDGDGAKNLGPDNYDDNNGISGSAGHLNQLDQNEKIPSFAEHFQATKLEKPGKEEGEQTTLRPYNHYKPSEIKGVASEEATIGPTVLQQIKEQSHLSDPTFNPLRPGQGNSVSQASNSGSLSSNNGTLGGNNGNLTDVNNTPQNQNPYPVFPPHPGFYPPGPPPGFGNETETTGGPPGGEDEDDDDDDDDDENDKVNKTKTRKGKQLNLANFLANAFMIPTTPRPQPPTTPQTIPPIQLQVDGQNIIIHAQPAPPPPPPATQPPQRFGVLSPQNFRDIVRILPDLFRGARQGFQFIQTISQLFGGLDNLGDLAGGLGGLGGLGGF